MKNKEKEKKNRDLGDFLFLFFYLKLKTKSYFNTRSCSSMVHNVMLERTINKT